MSFETTEAGITGDASVIFTPGDATGWSLSGADTTIPVAQYADGEELPYAMEGAMARRDSAFTGLTDNYNYLKLATGNEVLSRTAGEGYLFLDQLVKFTGFDEEPTLPDGTKIAVWMSEYENSDETTETNLYVTCAGIVNGEVTTNVLKIAGADYKLDTWYRLTIKMLDEGIYKTTISDNMKQRAGFIIYVNGEQVAAESDDAKTLIPYESEMTSLASGYMAKKMLFPAIDQEDALFNEVAYKGMGAIDDIIIDQAGPEFAQAIPFTVLNADDKLEILSVKAGDEDVDPSVGVMSGTEVTITYGPAAGFKIMGGKSTVTKTITSTIEIDPEEEGIEFAEIVATVTNGGITTDYAVSELYEMLAKVVEDDVVTFLATATIKDEEEKDLYTVASNTTITVGADAASWSIFVGNSDEGKANDFEDYVGAPAGFAKTFAFESEEGLLMLYGNVAGTIDVTVGSVEVADDIEVSGLLKANADEETFAIDETVTLVGTGKIMVKTDKLEGVEPTDDVVCSEEDEDGYYTYSIKTTFAVKVMDGENVTIESIMIGEEEVETPEAGDYDVPAGATITVTYAPAADYKWAGQDEDGVRTADEEGTINPPAVVEKAYVAQIGTDKYESLAEAFAAAANGDTIEVTANCTIDERINVAAAGRSITLDATDFTVTCNCLYPIVWGDYSEQNAGTLTIVGGTFQQDTEPVNGTPAMILWTKNGKIKVTDGTFNVTKGEGQVAYVGGADAVNGSIEVTGGAFAICDKASGDEGDVFNVQNTLNVTQIQVSGGTFTKDLDLGDDYIGPTFVADGYASTFNSDLGLWQVVPAAVKVGNKGFVDAAAALAAVQTLEAAGTYPITVTACFDDLEVTNPATSETITLAKDAAITITAAGWTFTGDVEGEVTLAYGKTITVPNGSALVVKAPEGYLAKPQAVATTTTWVLVPAVAEIVGGARFASIDEALTAVAASNETVRFLATDTINATWTSASTIDFNGQNVKLPNLTYKGDAETFTITSSVANGRDGACGGHTITVPSGVNLTITGLIIDDQITVAGGDGAKFTLSGCVFKNEYQTDGKTTDAQDGTKAVAYNSNCVGIGGSKFAQVDIVGNEFNMRYRQCIQAATAAFNATVFVYNNQFIGTKDCRTKVPDYENDYHWPAGLQIYGGQYYIENNTFKGEFAQGIFSLSGGEANVPVNIICRGNSLEDGVKYLWVNHNVKSLADNKVLFADNDWTKADPAFTTEYGTYGDSGTDCKESNAEKPYKEGVALPTGCESFYAWFHGDDAAKPYFINEAYAADLTDLADGDVLTAQPLVDVVIPAGKDLALSAIEKFENKFTVVAKPTKVTIAVKIGEGVTSVTYDSKTYTENFTIADVEPGAQLVFTEVFAGDEYMANTTVSADLSTEDGLTFTVAAELTSPTAEINFNTAVACACAYTIDGDVLVERLTEYTNAWVYAQDGTHYVKIFKNYMGSDWTEQFYVATTARVDFNDYTVVGMQGHLSAKPVAIEAAGDKFTTYTGYSTIADAYAEGGADATYVVFAATDATAVTLKPGNLEFNGHFWKGYNSGVLGSFTITKDKVPVATEPTLLGATKTSTWGATEGLNFSFVAEAIDYTVTFAKGDADGGTDVAAITFNYGDAKTAPECTWTYTGHEFVAWTNLAVDAAAIAAGDPLPTEVEDSYTLTAVWAEKSTPGVAPGGSPVNVEAKDEAEALSKVPQIEVDPPATADVTKEAYNAYFVKKADKLDDGTFNVYLDLKPEIVQAAKETEALAGKLSDISAAAEGEVDVAITNAKPGLYYSVIEGQTLQNRTEGARTLATGTTVTIKTTKFAGSGFYQIQVNASVGVTGGQQ